MVFARVMDRQGAPGPGAQATHNNDVWRGGSYLARYDHDGLLGAEAILLARYREAVSGRVLDVGCGAGRVLRYLDLLGADACAIDLSELMVAHTQRRFPHLDVHRGDLLDLGATETGPFDCVIIPDNTLDIGDDGDRRRVLADVRGLLAPDGVFIFTAHNLDCWQREGGEPMPPAVVRTVGYARDVIRGKDGTRLNTALGPLRAVANRRRLAPLQFSGADHAILNDSAHHRSLLHYYIGAPAQERQLAECGFELLEVRELDGTPVPLGQSGQSLWLHYVARPA
jgi:SAM-dependent methyltransferase